MYIIYILIYTYTFIFGNYKSCFRGYTKCCIAILNGYSKQTVKRPPRYNPFNESFLFHLPKVS